MKKEKGKNIFKKENMHIMTGNLRRTVKSDTADPALLLSP